MKISLLSILFAITSSFAFGAAESTSSPCGANESCPPSSARYDTLKSLFAQGNLPVTLEAGVYSGRCYGNLKSKSPDRSAAEQNAALVVTDLTDSENQGPLFPESAKILGYTLVGQPAAPINFFDKACQKDIKQAISLGRVQSAACEKEGSLTIAVQGKEGAYESYLLRQNGSNFITRNIFSRDISQYDIKAGDAFQYCYFFKKIR